MTLQIGARLGHYRIHRAAGPRAEWPTSIGPRTSAWDVRWR